MFKSRLWLEAGDEPDHWIVRRPLVWNDTDIRFQYRNCDLTVPEGFETDLASVPRFLRDREAFDVCGRSRRPAVLHDWLYATGFGGKEFADQIFHRALLAEGVSKLNAWAFYQAVNWFGYMAYRDHANRREAEKHKDDRDHE